jgi:membrane-associated phospholipid phosphatase
MGKAEDTGAPSTEGRPWRRATVWLIALGAFFILSYGVSHWLASLRGNVPAIVFGWEHAIPFLAWTIIPYWGTHVLFAVSFYLCRNRVELDSHAKRLLTAQLIAVACFVLFPLRVSFEKPQATGEFAYLFDVLGMFDGPFNEAPSLHVATTIILFDLYSRTLPRWTMPLTIACALLVGASVLTTYQHHFIDVPTGFLLGLLCLWMWPPEGGNRLASSRRVPSRFSK